MISCSCDLPVWLVSLLTSSPLVALNVLLFWFIKRSARREYLPGQSRQHNPTNSWLVFLFANLQSLVYTGMSGVLLWFLIHSYL